MTLGGEIIDLVRLYLADDPDQTGGVRQITIVQPERRIRLVRIEVEMINAVCIEERGPSLDAMDLIALREQQFGQIRTVLTRYAGY